MEGCVHGGDIYRNKVNIDFSVSINPLDWPQELKRRIEDVLGDISNIYTYPDITYETLRSAVAKYTGEPINGIVCGNGASELISGLCNLIRPKRVILTAPCYSGYERAAGAVGAKILYALTDEKKGFTDIDVILEYLDTYESAHSDEGMDMVMIGNPSNPAGALIEYGIYEKLVRLCEEKGVLLVVDECFAELSIPADKYRSSYARIRGKTLVRLRALTKSFRLAGLRLGYALCEDRELADGLYGIIPEWNVSTAAMKTGAACLEYECGQDSGSGYITASYEYIRQERERVADALRESGIKVYDSAANYLLIYSDINLYDHLLREGILIRDCRNITGLKEGYCRISLKSRTDDDRLIESIRSVKRHYERI